MNANSEQREPLNPKFAGALFFALYSLLIILILKFSLLKHALPLLPAILFALIIGALMGRWFANPLAKKSRWYRPFLIGVLLACFLLLLGSLFGVIDYFIRVPLPHWQDYFVLYGTTLFAFFLIVGLWFIPLTGLIALYFNKKFLPGLVAFDKQRIAAKNLMISNRVELFALMAEKAVVITPNNRLSNELLRGFFDLYPKTIQEKPLCLPYSAFLQLCYKRLCHYEAQSAHPLILNRQQSQLLWRQILAESTIDLGHAGLIQALEEAWTRCALWQIELQHPSFALTPETRQFQQWALRLQQELNKLDALTIEQVVPYLLKHPSFSYSYKRLIWACFDEFTPQQSVLQDLFTNQHIQNDYFDLSEQTQAIFRYTAKDEQDEFQQLIYWLKECLTKNETKIGVVVPNLEDKAQSLKRLLEQKLTVAFDLSLGEPLANYPLVAHALTWLELDGKQLSSKQIQLLLHSPYLAASQAELLARAQFREESKILQEVYLEQTTLIQELNYSVPELAKLLQELYPYPETAEIQAWIRHFKNRLRTLGFPGEYSLNSAQYQCYQRFLILFDEFKQCALVCAEMTKKQALSLFKHLAKQIIFQPKTEQSPIQILGFLEAAGCTFDSLWVCGLTDQCLPAKTKLSAFIPLNLQRDHRMPYANPEQELSLAYKTLNRLCSSSKQVVFSFPKLSADKPNLPSPLISELTAYQALKPVEKIVPLYTLVAVEESYKIPFAVAETARGGTAILANQAKCPFRAFAIHRLQAKTGLEITEGPNARERGQLIHKVMELVWQALETQANLLSLEVAQLDKLIEEAIYTALEPLIKGRPYSFSDLIQEVEFSKLKRLVHACLDWERQRPAFEVEALEQSYHLNLAGIDFQVRVDRLDKLKNGNKWVIDYKSSLPQSLPWNEERPQESQLILYALLDEAINGLFFAQLKAGQLVCKGLSTTDYSCSGLTHLKNNEHWQDYRKRWHIQLNELAQEFRQGHCPPQPLNPTICQNCDLQSLCRLN